MAAVSAALLPTHRDAPTFSVPLSTKRPHLPRRICPNRVGSKTSAQKSAPQEFQCATQPEPRFEANDLTHPGSSPLFKSSQRRVLYQRLRHENHPPLPEPNGVVWDAYDYFLDKQGKWQSSRCSSRGLPSYSQGNPGPCCPHPPRMQSRRRDSARGCPAWPTGAPARPGGPRTGPGSLLAGLSEPERMSI